MTNIDTMPEQILFAIAMIGLVWQAWILICVLAILRSGQGATYGAGPLLMAIIALIILWVIQ